MTTQLTMDLSGHAPEVKDGEVRTLIHLLGGRDWLKAKQIVELLAEQSVHWEDRKVRAVANASEGQVLSYPGSPGYKLTREATIEEIQTATAKIRHQATEMQDRALTIDRVYHGKK